MKTIRLTVLPAMALAFLLASTTPVSAFGHQIEGLWDVEVTLIPVCGGSALPNPIRSMIMFTRDHKIVETAGTPLVGPVPINRVSPGLGEWKHEGRRHFSAAFTFFRINVPANTFAGTQTITEDIELSHDGNEFIAAGTSQIVNADGSTPDATCNTLTGVRRK